MECREHLSWPSWAWLRSLEGKARGLGGLSAACVAVVEFTPVDHVGLFSGRQEQLDAQRMEDYVNADHDLYYRTRRSVEAPSERPGERRHVEMKRLYGDSAAKIQAMEAAVQLTFNKHFDRKRPKYWPVIPLKF